MFTPMIKLIAAVPYLKNRLMRDTLSVSKIGSPIKPLTAIIPIIEPSPNRRIKVRAISILSRVVAANAIKLPLPASP